MLSICDRPTGVHWERVPVNLLPPRWRAAMSRISPLCRLWLTPATTLQSFNWMHTSYFFFFFFYRRSPFALRPTYVARRQVSGPALSIPRHPTRCALSHICLRYFQTCSLISGGIFFFQVCNAQQLIYLFLPPNLWRLLLCLPLGFVLVLQPISQRKHTRANWQQANRKPKYTECQQGLNQAELPDL